MKQIIISQLIKVLMSTFTKELLEEFAKNTILFIEQYVKGTASKIDDAIVLPICESLKRTLGIDGD